MLSRYACVACRHTEILYYTWWCIQKGRHLLWQLMVYKRNSKFFDLSELVEELISMGLMDTLEKYYNKLLEKQALQ